MFKIHAMEFTSCIAGHMIWRRRGAVRLRLVRSKDDADSPWHMEPNNWVPHVCTLPCAIGASSQTPAMSRKRQMERKASMDSSVALRRHICKVKLRKVRRGTDRLRRLPVRKHRQPIDDRVFALPSLTDGREALARRHSSLGRSFHAPRRQLGHGE